MAEVNTCPKRQVGFPIYIVSFAILRPRCMWNHRLYFFFIPSYHGILYRGYSQMVEGYSQETCSSPHTCTHICSNIIAQPYAVHNLNF